MLKKFIAASILGSSLILSACQSTPIEGPSTTIEAANLLQLQHATWIATHIGVFEVKSDPSVRNIPSLQFDAATKRLSGSDGCNRIMGSYTAGRDTLNLTQMATTRMACPANNSGVEQKFQAALNQVTHYQVFNKTLKLLDRHGNPVLQFTSSVQPR